MRSRRRLAAVPVLLLALAACSSDGDDATEGEGTPVPAITGRGATELPLVEDQSAVLEESGGAVEGLAATIAAGATETGQVAETTAGPHTLRVVCTSSDGAPVTVTVTAGGTELTSYQAPCIPVFQGGTTMADSDPFEVPGGAVDLSVAAAAESVVAVGLVPAAG